MHTTAQDLKDLIASGKTVCNVGQWLPCARRWALRAARAGQMLPSLRAGQMAAQLTVTLNQPSTHNQHPARPRAARSPGKRSSGSFLIPGSPSMEATMHANPPIPSPLAVRQARHRVANPDELAHLPPTDRAALFAMAWRVLKSAQHRPAIQRIRITTGGDAA